MNHTLILCIVVCVFLSRVNGSLFGTDQPLISEADILRFEKSYQTELKAKKKSNKIPKTSSIDWEKPIESVSVPRVTPSNDRPKQSKQAGMEKSKDKNGVAIKEKTFFSKSQPRSIEDGNEKPAKKLRFQRLSRSVSSQPSTQNSSKRKSFWARTRKVPSSSAGLPTVSMFSSIDIQVVKSVTLALVLVSSLLPNLREAVYDGLLYTIFRLCEIGNDGLNICMNILHRIIHLPRLIFSRTHNKDTGGVSQVLKQHATVLDKDMASDILWNIAMEVYHHAIYTPTLSYDAAHVDVNALADGELDEYMLALETQLKSHVHVLQDVVGSQQRQVLDYLISRRSKNDNSDSDEDDRYYQGEGGNDGIQELVNLCASEIREEIGLGMPYVLYYKAYSERKYPSIASITTRDGYSRSSRKASKMLNDIQCKLKEMAKEQEELWRVVHSLYKRKENTHSHTDGVDSHNVMYNKDVNPAIESKVDVLLDKSTDMEIVLSSMVRDAADVRQRQYDGENKVDILVNKYNYLEIVLSSIIRNQALENQIQTNARNEVDQRRKERNDDEDNEEEEQNDGRNYVTSEEYASDQSVLRESISSREQELKLIMDTMQSFARDLKEVVAFVNEVEGD